MIHFDSSPPITHDNVIRALERGRAVSMDAIGWQDTTTHVCPDCSRPVKGFGARSPVRFEWGLELAHPHRCGKVVPFEARDAKAARAGQVEQGLAEAAIDPERAPPREAP